MALSQIKFNVNKSGLGRQAIGEDHISGMVFFTTPPAGFSGQTIQVGSVTQAEARGITTSFYSGITHYHVSEFFRINPNGLLWLGVFSGGTDFNKVVDLQTEAQGKIRQVGVFDIVNFATSQVSTLQTVGTTLDSQDAPLSILYATNITGVTNLPDLTGSQANKVSVIVGQDGNGRGNDIFLSAGTSVSSLGASLGAVARASVEESIAHVANFNVTGTDLDELKLADGTSLKNLTKSQQDALNDKRYIFNIKYNGLNGSYFNSSFTADNSDLDSIEKNRTIDKAIREVRTALLPRLNSPLRVTSEGKLDTSTVQVFRSLASRALERMESNNELSAFNVIINPDQDVLSTDEIELTLELVPVGVARTITVNIGFVAQVTTQ